jgi:hypothetical protein
MEPKFVSFDQLVKEQLARQTVDPMVGLFNHMKFYYDNSPLAPIQPIVTEDIDCEIVEPKQLPAAE